MAGQSRTLKLSILADIDNLKKNLGAGSKEVDGFGGKLGGYGRLDGEDQRRGRGLHIQ